MASMLLTETRAERMKFPSLRSGIEESKSSSALARTVGLALDRTARRYPHLGLQWTMLIAITGVMELGVFFPAGKTRVPRITPTLRLTLYSMAGARAKA